MSPFPSARGALKAGDLGVAGAEGNAEIASLRKEISELRQIGARTRDAEIASLKEEIDELRQKTETSTPKHTEIASLKQEIKDLKHKSAKGTLSDAEKESLQREIDSLILGRAERDAEMTSLKSLQRDRDAEIASLKQEISAKVGSHAGLASSQSGKDAARAPHEKEILTKKDTEIASLQRDFTSLKEMSSGTAQGDKDEEAATPVRELKDSRTKLHSTQRELERAQKGMERSDAKVEKLEIEIKLAKEKDIAITNLQAAARQKDDENLSLRNSLADAQDALDSSEKCVKGLVQELEELKTGRALVEFQLEREVGRMGDMEGLVRGMRRKYTEELEAMAEVRLCACVR